MNEKISLNPNFRPVGRSPEIGANKGSNKVQKSAQNGTSFKELLQARLKEGDNGIKFSRHALKRLESRQVQLNEKDIERLNEALDRVEAKGARDSLFLMNDVAYIVSVKNRTVITAVDGDSMKENIFTNIDSAVILDTSRDTKKQTGNENMISRLNRPDLIRRPEVTDRQK